MVARESPISEAIRADRVLEQYGRLNSPVSVEDIGRFIRCSGALGSIAVLRVLPPARAALSK